MPLLMCPQQGNSIHNIYDTFLCDKYTKMKISPQTKTYDNHLDHCVIREAHTAPLEGRGPGHAHLVTPTVTSQVAVTFHPNHASRVFQCAVSI